MKATEVTAGLAESNGSLLPGLWRDSLHVTCGLTACTPGSAAGPTLGNEYGKTLPLFTQGEMTSQRLWSRYDRHSVGLTRCNAFRYMAKIYRVIQIKLNPLVKKMSV